MKIFRNGGFFFSALFLCLFIVDLILIMQFFFLYLDPGSGSYLIQVIIAAVLGAGFFFRNSWTKIKSFFKKPEQKKEPENETAEE